MKALPFPSPLLWPVLACAALAPLAAAPPELRDLLRDGLYKEEVNRDPEGAAKAYQELLARYPESEAECKLARENLVTLGAPFQAEGDKPPEKSPDESTLAGDPDQIIEVNLKAGIDALPADFTRGPDGIDGHSAATGSPSLRLSTISGTQKRFEATTLDGAVKVPSDSSLILVSDRLTYREFTVEGLPHP